ncbi:MAG: hypothetical protein KAS30_03265, partial [Candidatus Diapherotrites archaeon]|nr:hypothetical protein [Candidatus Diapherotrites archaeon]
ADVEVRPKGIAKLSSSGKTDSDGKTISRGLLTNSTYNIAVSKKGYLNKTESDVKVLSNTENSLKITITTADFANSDFITIHAKTMTGNSLEATVNVYQDNVLVKSKEIEGTGEVLVDKSKKYMVSVYSDNYVAFVKTEVGAGELVTAEMELSNTENTSSLRVCVREEDTKAPLNGVSVVLFETSSKVLGMPAELTGSSGCAEFTDVPNGKTVIAKAYVGSTTSAAEQVTTPTTQEPQIDISATQTKLTVKVIKDNAKVSGATVTLFDNLATVLSKELSSPSSTDSSGVVEFDVVEGTQVYAVVESTGSAKYFSQVLNVDASKQNTIDVQLQNTTDSTNAVFLGLFDKFGNKTESVVASTQYHARIALNTATATDEAGLYLMTGLETNEFSAEDNVAIVGVMQAMGEPYSGTTYTPPLGEEIDSMG